jgi:ATP-dependent protease ClpP protease subunit
MDNKNGEVIFIHNPSEKNGRILFNSEVNSKSVQKLLLYLEEGFNYYQYNIIEIQLTSPGGEIRPMYHLIDNIHRYKNLGKIVATTALYNVASAAALILSSGSVHYRSAAFNSSILYHYSRAYTHEGKVITYEKAKNYTNILSKENEFIIKQLSNFAIATLNHYRKNMDRKEIIEKRIERFFEEAENLSLISESDKKDEKIIIKNFLEKDDEEQLKKLIEKVYGQLLRLEQFLFPYQAVDLLLIDTVGR